MGVLGELLDRAVVDDDERFRDPVAQGQQPVAPGRRLLGPADQRVVRVLQVAREQVATVVQDEVGLRRQHPAQVPVVLDRVGRRPADDIDAVVAQVGHGLGLGGVQVAGRDDIGAAPLERQQERGGLRFDVDAGADPEPLEGLRPVELGGRLPEQATAVTDPIESRH